MITVILLLLPLFFSIALFILRDEKWIRLLAVAGSFAEFVVALYGLFLYITQCHCQFVLNLGWIGIVHSNLRFGVDGISLLMVLLTTFLTPLVILSSLVHRYRKPSLFFGLMLLMEMALIGVFTTQDGLVFFIFWELTLLTAYFICALSDNNEKIHIPIKFIVYTLSGSFFLLAALVYIYLRTPDQHSFEIIYLYAAHLSPAEQSWLLASFFISFAVIIPIFPFHSWQPAAFTGAPAGGTMMMAGIMVKMGIYGLLRFLLPICSIALKDWGWKAILLSIIGIIYASLIAVRTSDLKRFALYLAIVEAGLIAAGIFTLTQNALEGAVIQVVSLGINITGFFIIITLIEKKLKTREIYKIRGMAMKAPWLAGIFLIILWGNIGLPLTNGFIGEYLLVRGIFEKNIWIAAIAGLTIILISVYLVRIYLRMMIGRSGELLQDMRDISFPEAIPLIPIVIMIFWIGMFPNFFLNLAEPAIREILNLVH